MGLLRSSWWLILGLFAHLTHLLASMLPPIVAVTLVVQSQAGCGCHLVLFAPVSPSCPLYPLLSSLSSSHNSPNTFLICSEGHPSVHHVVICLSCFVFLPSVPFHEICGKRAFSVSGTLKRLKGNAESFVHPLPPPTRFYFTEENPHFKSVWVRPNQHKCWGLIHCSAFS